MRTEAICHSLLVASRTPRDSRLADPFKMRRNEGNFQIVNDDSSEASAMLLRTLSGENGKTGGPLSEISQEHEIRVTDRRNRGASARLDSTRISRKIETADNPCFDAAR